jgi:hypothetical protein
MSAKRNILVIEENPGRIADFEKAAIDTNCAIVGGIVALSAGRESIPPAWLSAREPFNV